MLAHHVLWPLRTPLNAPKHEYRTRTIGTATTFLSIIQQQKGGPMPARLWCLPSRRIIGIVMRAYWYCYTGRLTDMVGWLYVVSWLFMEESIMKQIWFTCPRCTLQFKSAANHNHHCPRCNHYPCQIGKIKNRPVAPRVTRQLPPSRPSGTFVPMSGPVPPSMTGPMQPLSGSLTQGDWPTQPSMMPPPGGPPPMSVPSGGAFQAARANFRSFPLLVRIGCGMFLVFCLVVACIGIANGNGNNNTAAATATPGSQVALNVHPTNQPTHKPSATATPKPTATSTPKPTATPTPMPQPTATNTPAPSCQYQAVNGNPWCYNFQCCHTISSPPSNFCSYFTTCISSFWSGNGYVEECQDGSYSKSGGISGSCSHHGGNLRPLLAP